MLNYHGFRAFCRASKSLKCVNPSRLNLPVENPEYGQPNGGSHRGGVFWIGTKWIAVDSHDV